METQKKKETSNREHLLYTYGNKTVTMTVVGSSVVGAVAGATITGIIKDYIHGKEKNGTSPAPVISNEKEKDLPIPDKGNVNDVEEHPVREKVPKEPVAKKDVDEPRPTVNDKVTSKDEPDAPTNPDTPNTPEDPKNNTNGTPKESETNITDVENKGELTEDEINEIADNLIKETAIDERDVSDLAGIFDFTHAIQISLPNGLSTTGYTFNLEGEDYVLADLDGDGVFEDLLSQSGNTVTDINLTVRINGALRSFNDILASNHITESDIEQLANSEVGLDVAMTDTEREMIEKDAPEEDISEFADEPGKEKNQEEKNQETEKGSEIGHTPKDLTDDEIDKLLDDILNGQDEEELVAVSTKRGEELEESIDGGFEQEETDDETIDFDLDID